MRSLVILAALGLASCEPRGPTAPTPPFDLVPGFSTSLRPDQAIDMGGVKIWETLHKADANRPAFHDVLFSVDETLVFGERARVTVEFYNQVLMEVCIYATTNDALQHVRSELAARYSVDPARLGEGVNSGLVQLFASDGIDGKPFVCAAIDDVKSDFGKWVRLYS
jgi:hypothetical protein